MSEYWVSKKKYFCKYCEIYIADDAPSRQQHENGLRHQGNRERFIRGLYKTGEKRKKDLEDEKREMAHIELAAQAAFARDLSSGAARPSTSSSTIPSIPSASPPKKNDKAANNYQNYSSPQSLGYIDPDIERQALRATEGFVGSWSIVPAENQSPITHEVDSTSTSTVTKRAADPGSLLTEERAAKFHKRTLAPGLGEVYDPGVITFRPRIKREGAPEENEPHSELVSPIKPEPLEENLPETPSKWAPIKWQAAPKMEENNALPPWETKNEESVDVSTAIGAESCSKQLPVERRNDMDSSVKEVGTTLDATSTEAVDSQAATPVFRKRKVPIGAGRKRQ